MHLTTVFSRCWQPLIIRCKFVKLATVVCDCSCSCTRGSAQSDSVPVIIQLRLNESEPPLEIVAAVDKIRQCGEWIQPRTGECKEPTRFCSKFMLRFGSLRDCILLRAVDPHAIQIESTVCKVLFDDAYIRSAYVFIFIFLCVFIKHVL